MSSGAGVGGGERPSVLAPDLLALVPGCERGEAPLELIELSRGSINRTLFVATRAGPFVLRHCGADAARLGVDRHREAAFQRQAASADLAPPVQAVSADAHVMVAPFVPGRACTSADFADARRIERLGAQLRKLHELARPADVAAVPFDPLSHIRDYAAQVVHAVPQDQALIASVVARAAIAVERGGGATRGAAIVHLDLHPDNVIECEPEHERLVFIDWEYAAWADPALDLAAIVAIEPAVEPHIGRLIRAAGLGHALSRPQLEALRIVFEATHWLWYRAHRLAGPGAPAARVVESRLFERLQRALR